MRVVIINGEPDAASAFDGYVRAFSTRLTDRGNDVREIVLRDIDLRGCTGCFGCWLQTPGECVQHDDGAELCRAVIDSDLVVFAAPMVMGYPSALVKRSAERLIPLLHPYIEIEGGEMHHRKRYERYPQVGLLVSAGPDTDAEDLELTRFLWQRLARDFKSRLVLFAVADRSPKEVADELVAAA
jgi:multimeric flavodoxin WrbA